MANLLGVPSYDPTLDREVRQFNSELLQNLGKQIRQDVTTIQTNRQLQGLAQGLQQVDPATPQFGKSVISLMTQYPLATKTPIGQAAISQLGAEHKFWQQEQLRNNEPWAYAGQGVAYNRSTGATKQVFEPPAPAPRQPPRPVVVNGKTGSILVDPVSGQEINRFGDPFADVEPKSSRAEKPSFRSEVEYNNLQPYVKGLDEVRAKLKASGVDPEAPHSEIEKKLGAAGKELSAQREFFQKALTVGEKTWKDSEAFVRTFDKRYQSAPVEAVIVAPVGANRAQVEAAAVLPTGPATEEVVALQSAKPLDPETKQRALDAIKTGRSRDAVLKRLQEAGFDVTGL